MIVTYRQRGVYVRLCGSSQSNYTIWVLFFSLFVFLFSFLLLDTERNNAASAAIARQHGRRL